MPTPISIRERIERQLLTNLSATPGIGVCSRWDGRGLQRYGHLDCFITLGDDSVDEAAMGHNYDVIQKRATLTAGVVLHHDETSTIVTAQLANYWIAMVEKRLMADPQLVEDGTGARLCVDIIPRRTGAPEYAQGANVVSVGVDIVYEHYRNDPFAGPGLTELTE